MEIERIDDTSVSAGGQRLSTAEVERVIHDLAVARGSMKPPIPDDMRDSAIPLVLERDPHFIVSLAVGGDITMAIRHGGYGWVPFTLSPERAALIRDYLAKRTRNIPATNLEDQVAGPHGAH